MGVQAMGEGAVLKTTSVCVCVWGGGGVFIQCFLIDR